MKTSIRDRLVMVAVCLATGAGACLAAVEQAVPLDYTSSGLRDPFQAYVTKEEAPISPAELKEEVFNPPVLDIQGITWGSSFPQAIVNNKVVKAGDTIEGAQIVQIKSNAIIFKIGNREFTLASPASGSAGKKESNP